MTATGTFKSPIAAILAAMSIFTSAAVTHAQDYLIGSQDVIKISVFEYPDLTTEVRVSEDGRITFPLLGEIEVKNLSPRQVEKAIAQKLSAAKIVKTPQVSVFIQQYRNSKVTIIGEVVKPGQYEILSNTTLLDAVSLALGTNLSAGHQLTLFRKVPGEGGKEITKKIVVDLDNLLNGGELTQNYELRNGDIIYVPKATFYIYGEVNRPGAYRLEKGLTIKRAIAMAGGLTAKGTERRIEVTRRTGTDEATVVAGIDDPLRNDEVVRIKESIF